MTRSPEMMQVFLFLKESDKLTSEDKILHTFSTMWGVRPESVSDYANANLQTICITALDPGDVDVATKLIEAKPFRYEQETIIPKSRRYIPLLNISAVYIGPDNYLDALTDMCVLAKDIIKNCRATLPGF